MGRRHGGQVAQLADLLLDLLVSRRIDRAGFEDLLQLLMRVVTSPVSRSLRMMSRALSLSCGGDRIIGIVLYLSCNRKMRAVLSPREAPRCPGGSDSRSAPEAPSPPRHRSRRLRPRSPPAAAGRYQCPDPRVGLYYQNSAHSVSAFRALPDSASSLPLATTDSRTRSATHSSRCPQPTVTPIQQPSTRGHVR